MRITADTNVLVRAITEDDPRQSEIAQIELRQAELVAVPLPVLCELAWVLSRGYNIAAVEVAEAIRRVINAANVVVDRQAAEAGVSLMDAGGDFADGVIAFDGARLGAEAFVSFDKRAVSLLNARNMPAILLG